MIAIDTNVLLRTLVDDPQAPAQCKAARRLIVDAGHICVSAVVFLETMWTLSRSFGYSRKEVARVGALLLGHPRYRIQSAPLFEGALARFVASNIDFSDAVALEDAAQQDIMLHTFDGKLAKLDGACAVDAAA